MKFHDRTCSQPPGIFRPVYWTLCIHGIKIWKTDKNASICVSTETQYKDFLLNSILIYKVSSDRIENLQILKDVLWSYDVLWIHLSTHQNNMNKQNMEYNFSMFPLYKSIVFFKFFLMGFPTVLWHYITICHGIPRNTGFYLRKGIHDICCI